MLFTSIFASVLFAAAAVMHRFAKTSTKLEYESSKNEETSDAETASTMDDADSDADISCSDSISDDDAFEPARFDEDFNAYDWQGVAERVYFVFCCAEEEEE